MAKVKNQAKGKSQEDKLPKYLEIKKRVDSIIKLLSDGWNEKEIRKSVMDKDSPNYWGVSIETVNKMIKQSKEYFTITSQIDRNVEIGKTYLRLEDLYYQAMKDHNYKIALSVIREKANIFGLGAYFDQYKSEQYILQQINKLDLNGLSDEQLSYIANGEFVKLFGGSTTFNESKDNSIEKRKN